MPSTVTRRDVRSAASGGQPTGRDALAELLAMAARGDHGAFMRFYDLTCAVAYRAALATCPGPACAEDLACSWYARAWAEAPAYASSGLSPVAWLLSRAEPAIDRRAPDARRTA